MENRKTELLKSSLLLLGAFIFAYNASVCLHELGHAIGFWVTGSSVERLIIYPFAWSRCVPASVSDFELAHPSFTTWAGPVFGVLMGLVLSAIVWRWRGPYVILAIMTGVTSCIYNALYLLHDSFANIGGDASRLISYGTPKLLVIAVGLLMMGAGIVLAGKCLSLIGIQLSYGIKERILVLGGGLLPYTIVLFIYDLLYNRTEVGEWAWDWPIIIGLMILIPVLTKAVLPRWGWFCKVEGKRVTWLGVVIANLGAFVILTIILILARSYKPEVTTTNYRLGYYDNQSNFAGTKLKITHDITAAPGKIYEFGTVIFWNWQGRKGKTEIANSAHFMTIRPDTNEVIVQTIDGVLIIPMSEEPYRWVLKEDDAVLFYRYAISSDAHRMLACSRYDGRYSLIALDFLSGHTAKFELLTNPDGMAFIDDNTAVASVGEDMVKVEFAESGEHKFVLSSGAAKHGSIKAIYKGEIVFYARGPENQSTIQCGDMKVLFNERLDFVLACESYIWAMSRSGQVFRVESAGNKVCAATYSYKEIIGQGVFDDNLWIAFNDGTVRVFGDTPAVAKIELP